MLAGAPITAQQSAPVRRAARTTVDSALVARILLAEDRRDSTDAALTHGTGHREARVRAIAIRAKERIADPVFARRDSLPGSQLPAPPVWPEPDWKPRYRSLTATRDDCTAMRAAIDDAVPAVRMRASALVRASCAGDRDVVDALRDAIRTLPASAESRDPGAASWHDAAHAAVALARLHATSAAVAGDSAGMDARFSVPSLARHNQWQVRQYVVRAAAVVQDTATLRALARDTDDNVAEVAIDALARLTGRADDPLFLASLGREGAQVVRAAARALKGTSHAEAPATLASAFDRFVARANASERDARVALLEAMGRTADADRPPPRPDDLPPDAVALALGAERYLQVTMSPRTGGGHFTVRLRGDVAPLTAARVLAHARAGGYDGTQWHRVEHDFVVQGGGPGANEYVGASRHLIDELGTVPHARGTVGMSTRGHDTGDAQWFINLRDNLPLGRDYTVFAEVVQGMDVVDAVLEGDVIATVREVSASTRRGPP